MTGTELISVLTDHGFEDTSTARKEAVLNEAINEILSDGPWRFQEEEASITLSTRTPTLPADHDITLSITVPASYITLVPEELDWMSKNFGDLTSTGIPAYYYYIGGELNVYPVPSSSLSGKIMYLKGQTAITSASAEADIIIPAKHHYIIAFKALELLYAMEDDPELAAVFSSFYDRRLTKMKAREAIKQLDRPRRIHDVFAMDDYWDVG